MPDCNQINHGNIWNDAAKYPSKHEASKGKKKKKDASLHYASNRETTYLLDVTLGMSLN